MGKPAIPIRRGAVVWVDLDPAVGAEQNKTRPAVIVSNDTANSRAISNAVGVVTIVPLTGNVGRVLPFQVFVAESESGLPRDSKAQAEQVRSVDVTRVGAVTGVLSPPTVSAIDEALILHLGL